MQRHTYVGGICVLGAVLAVGAASARVLAVQIGGEACHGVSASTPGFQTQPWDLTCAGGCPDGAQCLPTDFEFDENPVPEFPAPPLPPGPFTVTWTACSCHPGPFSPIPGEEDCSLNILTFRHSDNRTAIQRLFCSKVRCGTKCQVKYTNEGTGRPATASCLCLP